jgi:hypothetical protein
LDAWIKDIKEKIMRRSDIASPRLLNKEVRCYNCQKVSKPEVIKLSGERPGEKYSGNLKVKKETPVVDSEGKVRYNYELFTGKYIQKFGFFCSVNCGLVWACHEIQRRVDKKKEINSGLSDQNKDVLSIFKKNLMKEGK